MSRDCPRCDRPLSGAPPWETCARCGGTFVERSAVTELLEKGAAFLPSASPYRASPTLGPDTALTVGAVRYLRCPCCSTIMNRSRVAAHLGVVVDVCLAHGVWFDSGELEQASEHLREQQRRGADQSALAAFFELFFTRRQPDRAPLDLPAPE